MRVWDVARTPQEIMQFKDSCILPQLNLELFYNFEQKVNTDTVVDFSGNGFEGISGNGLFFSTSRTTGIHCTGCEYGIGQSEIIENRFACPGDSSVFL